MLQDQVDQLSNRISYRPKALAEEQQKLKEFEDDVKKALDLNEKYEDSENIISTIFYLSIRFYRIILSLILSSWVNQYVVVKF